MAWADRGENDRKQMKLASLESIVMSHSQYKMIATWTFLLRHETRYKVYKHLNEWYSEKKISFYNSPKVHLFWVLALSTISALTGLSSEAPSPVG